ncbi:hypothetical protein PISMIDRAFT_119159, partial [Pisolithus microcarpus 441]
IPKIVWSQLHHRFTPGFESILEEGVNAGWYNIDNTLERLVFQWLFIPWLQQELDAYRDHVNNTAKRGNHNKVSVASWCSNLIYEAPGDYGALDFKVKVDPPAIEHVQMLYIMPSHPIFDLHMDCPSITRENVWTLYLNLCSMIREHANAITVLRSSSLFPATDDDSLPLYEGQELLFNKSDEYYYMGGVRNGLGLGDDHLQQLNELEANEPDIEDDGPALVLPAFSDDDGDDDTNDDW